MKNKYSPSVQLQCCQGSCSVYQYEIHFVEWLAYLPACCHQCKRQQTHKMWPQMQEHNSLCLYIDDRRQFPALNPADGIYFDWFAIINMLVTCPFLQADLKQVWWRLASVKVLQFLISLLSQNHNTVVFQLIRTTYFTRFDQRKRKDDDQPMRAEELELMMAAKQKAAKNEIGNLWSSGLWKEIC